MMRMLAYSALTIACLALLVAASLYGASRYYTSQSGEGCASCHEMASYRNAAHGSAHRNVGCMQCHTASLATKLRHIRVHMRRNWPETIRLRDVDVLEMVPNCQSCHQHEYASWHAGPHSATYSQIFADPAHNAKRRLMDDCLRCHGMHFNDGIRELVQPVNTEGPWKVVRSDLADQPAMPCQACHEMHREGEPQARPSNRISVAGQPVHDTLAFFDRREQMHFASTSLAIPEIYDGARAVKVSQDQRAAVCYQCHAPRQPEVGTTAALNAWGPQVGSGDDRTPIGVHEGLSCMSCHDGHNENARASCKTCHPQMSHCGLDVEKMDTTFLSAASAHNIHWVRCTDCHQHGIPKKKAKAPVAKSSLRDAYPHAQSLRGGQVLTARRE